MALVVAACLASPALADHGRNPVTTEQPDVVRRLLDAAQPIVVVDVRPGPDYRAAHVPGARSVPRTELALRAHEIPQRGQVVVYSDTMFEARWAYELLRSLGYRNVTILEGGLVGWSERGLPVERGP
ncbi:MAG TPA: rhodanese-like domain-containing protein [Methylomirabilota bacterium]|jgi:rhodanese-related sulfurtransferase|nr:rhodanese-like domain-containing protein [Methylomirabilota bacterium]